KMDLPTFHPSYPPHPPEQRLPPPESPPHRAPPHHPPQLFTLLVARSHV
ncbi:hypothetical protein A2U01_0099239, partial [Trifolium medium]|nr:hypothetical protein [Trifolium medium]